MKASDLIGRWDIVSWLQRYDDGRITHPLGERLNGHIHYLPDGEMFCMISRADRPAFTTGGQWNASTEEKAAAYSGMLTYAGSYDIEGDCVSHSIALSLFPNWVGGVQRRLARLEGDTLYLEARLEESTPQARTAQLVWTRTR
jgi:hypothetical protein